MSSQESVAFFVRSPAELMHFGRWRKALAANAAFATKTTTRKNDAAPPASILERYKQFQASHPEHIVLMQVGDFFEIYGDAVESAARILDISATRAPGKLIGNDAAPVPMTGFPVRSFETYLGKLIKAGKSVVVAEQFPVPMSARFDRQITRIVTPGTVVEEHLLDRALNNYILLIQPGALAWMDVSTGDFWASTLETTEELLALLARLRPREILIDARCRDIPGGHALQQFAAKNGIVTKTVVDAPATKLGSGPESPIIQIDTQWKPTKAETACAAALAALVRSNTLLSLNLKPLRQFVSHETNMTIDAASFRSLDILVNSNSSSDPASEPSSSLLATLDVCKTALGSRLLRRRLQAPMLDVTAINTALDGVQVFFDGSEEHLTALRTKLDAVADIERILQRLLLFRPQGVARDLRSLSKSLLAAAECFAHCELPPPQGMDRLRPALERILSFIAEEKVPLRDSEGGFIRPGVDEALDELRRLRDDSASVFAQLEASYRQLSQIPNLRIVNFKGDQQVIEVPKAAISQMANNENGGN